MKKLYIITGASGFLGNNIVSKLGQAGEGENEIRALVLPGDEAKSLDGLDCRIFYGDVTKKETLAEIFDFDIKDYTAVFVIHCAAVVYIKSKYNPKVYDVNVNGTKNMADMALEKNAKLVYVSSVHAISEKPNHETMAETLDFDPDKVKGLYAKTKAEAARYVLEMVKQKGLNACIVHPSGIIGPNDYENSHMTQLVRVAAAGKLYAIVNGGYDFADVRDVADGIICACSNGGKGECYILSNRFISVRELTNLICETKGLKKIKVALPIWMAKMFAPLCELYYNVKKVTPLFTGYSLYTLSSNANFCKDKARKILGYKNRDLKETISDTTKWLESAKRKKLYGRGI